MMDRGSNKDINATTFNDDEIDRILHPNNLFNEDLRPLDRESNSGAIEDIINPSLDQGTSNHGDNNSETIENAVQRVAPSRMNNQLLPTRIFRPPVTAAGSPSATRPTGHRTRPAFVNKVWSMLNDESNSNLIRWSNDGKSFVVVNREEFVHQVLPKYFKHSNFASFVRQLNMYGWHKVQDVRSGSIQNSSDEKLQFENEFFIRGREDLLQHIVRQRGNQARLHGPSDSNVNGNATAGNGEMHLSEYLLGDNINFPSLLNELEQIKHSQLAISKELLRINKDNELLWKENMLACERHRTQQQALEKILRFLASLVPHMDQKMIAENVFQDANASGNSPSDIPGLSGTTATEATDNVGGTGVSSPGINGQFPSYDNEFQDFPGFYDGSLSPLDTRYLLRNAPPNGNAGHTDHNNNNNHNHNNNSSSNNNNNSNDNDHNSYDSKNGSFARISEIPFDEEDADPSAREGSNRSSFLSNLRSNMEEQDARIQQLEDMVTSQARPNSKPRSRTSSRSNPPLLHSEDNLMSLQENSPAVVVQDMSTSHTNNKDAKRVMPDDDELECPLIEEIDTKRVKHDNTA